MEIKKLVPQFKRGESSVIPLFDLQPGKFVGAEGFTESDMLNGTGKIIGAVMTAQMNSPRTKIRSVHVLNMLETGISETKGGTIERFNYAVGLFKYMGFMVEWDGTLNHPKVGWIDTEGWSADWDIPAFIKSKLMDDVEEKPVDVKLHEHFHQQVSNLRDSAKHRIDFTIDSIIEID